MLPASSPLYAFVAAMDLCIGAVIGALVGVGFAVIPRNSQSHIGLDAILGAGGLFGTLMFFAWIPWPTNTVDIVVNGQVIGSSTMAGFQHEWPAAWTTAVLLPIAHEIYQRWRSFSN
jgi:hypothetical protein